MRRKQQRRWFGRWQLGQRDLRRREIRAAFAPLVDAADRRVEAAHAELAAATERLEFVLLEQAIELLMVGAAPQTPRLRRRLNHMRTLTRAEVLTTYRLTEAQLSAARGLGFPKPAIRNGIASWVLTEVWSAPLIDEWLSRIRPLLPDFPRQSSPQVAAEAIDPIGETLMDVSDARRALGLDDARRSEVAEMLGFPKAFVSTAGVCDHCGGPVRRQVVRRADLCQWIERLRALDPGFARTQTVAA